MTIEAGTVLGHLRLGEPLGEGGMGSVYAAVDERLKRPVAVKILRRRGADERRRLLGEARMLSRLDHPHVCRVYDVVEHEQDGERLSLLVMERIAGTTLAELDLDALSVGERLRMAVQMAEAVEAAHATGIVHRDLKPGNVMVTEAAEIKVLDFGLARPATAAAPARKGDAEPIRGPSEEGTDAGPAAPAELSFWHSVATGSTEGLAGTPGYMSPEQARGEAATAASDVFSLGMMLHELFSGESAYGEQAGSPHLISIAANGTTRPLQGVDGDLAELVERMKSTNATARPSVREVLHGLRRIADKPSRRRRRWLAAALVALMVAAAAKYATDLQRERDRALASRDEAEAAIELMLDVFGAPDPLAAEWQVDEPRWRQDEGEPVTARQVLDRGVRLVDRSIPDRPVVRARLQAAMGLAFGGIGEYERAVHLLEDAAASLRGVSGAEPDLASALEGQGSVARAAADPALAEASYREALEIRRALGDAEGVARNLEGIAYVKSLYRPDPESESLLLESLDILRQQRPEETLRIASVRYTLGWHYLVRGDFDQALEQFSTVAEVLESSVPELHPARPATLHGYGETLRRLGRLDEASEALRRSLALNRQILGEDHPRIVINLTSLAGVLRRQGRYGEAVVLVRRAVEISNVTAGPDSGSTASVLASLTTLQKSLGLLDEAEASARRSVEIYLELQGPDSYPTLISQYNLASVLWLSGRHGEAARLLHQVLEKGAVSLGERASLVRSAHAELAKLELDRKRPAAAEAEVLKALGGDPEPEADAPADLRAILGACHVGLGRVAEGRRLLEEAVADLLVELGPAPLTSREALRYLVDAYRREGLGDSPEARRYMALLADGEALAVRTELAGPESSPATRGHERTEAPP